MIVSDRTLSKRKLVIEEDVINLEDTINLSEIQNKIEKEEKND